VDTAALQRRLLEATRTWEERLADAVHAEHAEHAVHAEHAGHAVHDEHAERDDESAARVVSRFAGGFPEAYKEDFDFPAAVYDLGRLEALASETDVSVHLYDPDQGSPRVRRFKLYRRHPLSLTDVLPMFTDLGLEVIDERPYEITDSDDFEVHVYDFGLGAASAEVWGDDGATANAFEEAFVAVWSGRAESDALNALVLTAGLHWRQVVILRTIARYLRQIGSAFSVEYQEAALVANPALAAQLVELFETRFDPDGPAAGPGRGRDRAEQEVADAVSTGLESVASLDQDRILRAFVGVVRATLRTNYYRVGPDGEPAPQVSLKLDCHRVPGLPDPKPMFEIWVYGPRVEGVHLRFGKVARGGLRWSDRREDFRTEVLGLVKAQMVKNAVIVPTGSKGGFIAKRLPDPGVDRQAWLDEGVAAYKSFIRGMLDITDNRVGSAVVPPARVVRHDDDDPYLVVAADKGTASFSDIANDLSREYGFWLDDAFASGGSAGYDHKAMGITARGAWESVKRHFREFGQNTQTEDFTVVGIGDMSGDVFGNGMLLSEHIRLVAAFDHRHVFLDPTPDAGRSYPERKRLFELPRSSWADYDAGLLSEGGGVFPRSAKSVPVSRQVREALGLDEAVTALTPAELIHAILLAPVDLVFNGGIGTYIKSSRENNADIGDRANDAIRVDGGDLRCRVVGEGGNLGASQLGRIEAASNGVRINTDAIDNSAGVGTSDREVNIKILLTGLTRDGVLTMDERNELLASMTDEVAHQVLRDNYEQNVLLGNSRAQSLAMLPVHHRLIQWLEARGELDRAIEYLPGDAEIARREGGGQGLTLPEFCVLVAYSKLALKADLTGTDLADGQWFQQTLADYFPEAIRERYADQLAEHPLRREIIINAVVNSMVNRGGITFAFRATDETGASSEQVAQAFVASREIFGLSEYVAAVEALDNVVDTATQTSLYLGFRRLLDRASRWFVHNRPDSVDVEAEVERFRGPVQQFAGRMGGLLLGAEHERYTERVAELRVAGVPQELAESATGLLASLSLLDVVEIADGSDGALEEVAPLYFAVSEHFGIDDLLIRVAGLPRDDRWDALARAAMRDDLYSAVEALTRAVRAGSSPAGDVEARIAEWSEAGGSAVPRAVSSLEAISAIEQPGIASLSVALRTLRALVRPVTATG
ncbi:MAG: NAD-glutamate dehydrogenase, partial [Actinomycetales bacterium]|nr:NAD-glutamate dehydrogenase [Actinomycetales bacterium]